MATIPVPVATTSPNLFPVPSAIHYFLRMPSRAATWHSSTLTPLRAARQDISPPVKGRGQKANGGRRFRHVEEHVSEDKFDDDVPSEEEEDMEVEPPTSMPKPPAGFVVDPNGSVLMASNRRLITIVDPKNNLPLECVIRRIFRTSQGKECMLLCPVDMPVLILRSTNFSGWSLIDDQETEPILPTASFALAKIHIHLVNSGFSFTARGGFCYTDEAIMEFNSGEDDETPAEGVEITKFNFDGSHYMIYTPVDPLLFVVAKDENGVLQIADDDLLADPAVAEAIDEESAFNSFVDAEEAFQKSIGGEEY